MNNPKLTKVASILTGIIIAVLIIFMAFKLVQNVFIRAEDYMPRDVVITEITQNSAKVSWSTAQETQGVVEYGTSPTALNFFAPEAAKTKSHLVDLTLLSPTTTYYFQIRVGDKKYDNGGVPWTFSTKGSEIIPTPVASPTPTKPVGTPTPTPVQTIETTTDPTTATCDETDCDKIKAKLGLGCTTQDYFKCVKALTPTASATATPVP
jgi:hypothetical protein